MRSNYVCAGAETLLSILDRFFGNPTWYQNHFTRQGIDNFFSNTCNKFLHSYGSSFAGRKSYTNYDKKEAELLTKTRSFGFMDSCEWIIDSGGFQASVGILDRKDLDLLASMYYGFLTKNKDAYDRAFILDIPPGPGCKLFTCFEDVYKLNLKSYTEAQRLPEEVRKKIVYIHHFRTPKLWDIYSKIMDDNDLFGSFQYHATGGIVANSSGDSDIPCIIYVLPLIPLLNQTIRHQRSSLKFHVLGGATFRDILFYELFQLHIKRIHNIDLEITYDSSGLFKGLMVGRYLSLFDDGTTRKLDLRENHLGMRYKDDIKVIDMYRKLLVDMSIKHNFKEISLQEVYDPKTGTFYEENRVYSLMYMLEMYSQVQDFMREEASRIYPHYQNLDLETFNSEAENITRKLNSGKITKKQKAKTYSISRSLDMLTQLDEEFCKYVVDKCLSKDEFVELLPERKEFLI